MSVPKNNLDEVLNIFRPAGNNGNGNGLQRSGSTGNVALASNGRNGAMNGGGQRSYSFGGSGQIGGQRSATPPTGAVGLDNG